MSSYDKHYMELSKRAAERESIVRDMEQQSEWKGTERDKRYTEQFATKLPSDSAERKSMPIMTGVLDYFPDAIAEIARLSKAGNDKHNPGEPLNWSRGKSDDHADCIIRHMMERGKVDEFGFLHEVSVAWRALAQLQLALEWRRA